MAVDGGLDVMRSLGDSREQVRERLTPPRTAVPPDELRRRLADGPLGPWWSEQVAAAVLPLFEVGDDGLARARLPFAAHMAILDDLLDTDAAALLPSVRCPAWLVVCEGLSDDGPWAAGRAAALERAGTALAQPRLLRWAGAVHDVPLQWPALVSGLVRAAVDEVATAAGGAGSPA